MESHNAKFRTVKTAYEEIKRIDPDTAISKYAIQQAVYGGYVPAKMVGTKHVFNLNDLLDYFNVSA
jgi:hypothetical protein